MGFKSLVEHEYWRELRRYIRKDGWRFFVRKPKDADELKRFLDMRINCAHCYREIKPVRQSKSGYGLYLAFTCPLDAWVMCSRSAGAKIEARRTRRALR